MQVFKTFMKILKKKMPSAFIYIGIFMLISIIMATQTQTTTDFSDTKVNVSIIDEDNSPASKALTDYIDKTQNLVEIENDKDKILDAIYYESIDYVLTIKSGYADKLSDGNTEELFTNYKVPNSYTATFFDNKIDEYTSTLSAYIAAGNDLDSAITKTSETLSQETTVTKENFNGNTNSEYSVTFSYYFQYQPYIFLSVLITALCPVLLVMNSKEVHNRTNCSAITNTSQNFQQFLASGIVVVATWLIFMITAFFFNDCKLNSTIMLAILNSFVFMLVATAIALLISSFSPNTKSLNMIANIVGLGMSFLCGIFVPQSMLGDGVLKAARFLPAYWYVKANNMLAGTSGDIYTLEKYMKYIGIEFAFAAAIFALILLMTKARQKAKI